MWVPPRLAWGPLAADPLLRAASLLQQRPPYAAAPPRPSVTIAIGESMTCPGCRGTHPVVAFVFGAAVLKCPLAPPRTVWRFGVFGGDRAVIVRSSDGEQN